MTSSSQSLISRRAPSQVRELYPYEAGRSESELLRSPAVFGFRIRELLGRGRKSTVYLADDLLRGHPVALKLTHRAHLECSKAASFLNEYGLIWSIRSPHVIRAYAQGITGDFAFLATEHAAAGDLSQRMEVGITANQAFEFLTQAAAGLAAVHQQGLVHRDVKPANLLIHQSGNLLLADFGSACARSAVDTLSSGSVVGTPRYAAPEQSRGAPAMPTADVYSLGAIFFEMLCHRPLFPGQTLTELLCQHVMAPMPRLPQELLAFQPLLETMLAKEPCDRPQHGGEVLAHVEKLNKCF